VPPPPLPSTVLVPTSQCYLATVIVHDGRVLEEDAAAIAHASHVLQKRMKSPATRSSAEFRIESLSANNSAKSCKVWSYLNLFSVVS
jgi:hypothetical protein